MKDPLIVDVRAPCEHDAEKIIGSLNVPLLSNEERAEVGTIYKQKGEVVARRHALKIIAPKIPALVDEILSARHPGQSIVVHCWRGGLRSEAVSSFLSVVGVDCWRLTGGYKAWRRQLLQDFQDDNYQILPVVLHGLTGVGKTEILHELSQRHALTVLDLEALANHRGSVFGGMGLSPQPTQKNFDAALWQLLKECGGQMIFLEAESRKVGKLALPDFLIGRMSVGRKILITGTLDCRAQRIVKDYGRALDLSDQNNALQPAISLLHSLKERLGSKRLAEIEEQLRSGALLEAVKMLLTDYYDLLYIRQIERAEPFDLEVCGDDVDRAAEEIAGWSRVRAEQDFTHTKKNFPPR